MTISVDSLIADYITRNPESQRLAERAKGVLPGGNTRTGVWMDPFPPYIERAEGVYLIDADGHRLLDFVFNNSSMILGHAHPAVVEAVQAAAAGGTGFNRPTRLEIDLAELLQARLPSLELLRFCNSGTEAVMLAIRAAIGFTGKRGIAKFEGAYHGTTDQAMVSYQPSLGPDLGPADRPHPVHSSAGLSASAEEMVVLPFNDLAATTALLEEHADRLAAVIVDPLMTNTGLILPEAGFLQGLREVTERLGLLLIFDEVVSFRVGPGGARGRYSVRPDMTTLGKVAVGGTAGGVVGGRREIMAQFDPSLGGRIPQHGTFNGNPLTMAAGLTTLRLLTEETFARMEGQTRRLCAALDDTLERAGVPGSTSHAGSIFRVHLLPTPPRTYREWAADNKAAQRVLLFWLLNHDIHWAAGGYVSAVTMDAHLELLVERVRAALAAW